MGARIEHSVTYSPSIETVHAAFTSEQYWKDRLEQIGGPGAQLVGFTAGDGSVTVEMVQTIPAAKLPSAVTAVRPGDLQINRTETWGPLTDTATGGFTAEVKGAPGDIRGARTLSRDGEGTRMRVDGTVEVKIPLLGGAIENVIVEQLRKLLAREDEFNVSWFSSAK